MPYQPLRPDPSTPPNLRDYIALFVDVQFADVHSMLRLPAPALGLEAGCNYAAASWSFALLSGTARMFVGKRFTTSGEALTYLLATFYPWNDEPSTSGLAQPESTKYLGEIRNLLVHSLGVLVKPRTKRPGRQIVIGPLAPDVPYGVTIHKSPLLEPQVEELEVSTSRPSWLGPTLRLDDQILVLSVAALYRGVRLTLERATANGDCIDHAQRIFRTFVENNDDVSA